MYFVKMIMQLFWTIFLDAALFTANRRRRKVANRPKSEKEWREKNHTWLILAHSTPYYKRFVSSVFPFQIEYFWHWVFDFYFLARM
jgi:hypothetical protein